MYKIYYSEKDRSDKFWRLIAEDPDNMSPWAYPVFPAIKYITSEGKILECGCGLGRVVNYFHRRGYKIIGLDYNFYALRQLKENHHDRLVLRGNAISLPFEGRSFSYVFLIGVIDAFEFKKDREEALKEACRVLRDNGKLFLSVPNANSIFWLYHELKRNSFVRKLFGKQDIPKYFCQYCFKKNEIYKELRKIGFSVEKTYYVNSRFAIHRMFPFLRYKIKDNSEYLMKLERQEGENAYKLNTMGNLFHFIVRHLFIKFIAPCIYFVAKNKER
jgi:SAM-dependent methyltransferase